MSMSLKDKRGFTLIELLVVIAVVGVLAGIVMVAINPATRLAEARDAGKKNDVGQVATAMEAYFTRKQVYPNDVNTLVSSGDLKRNPGTVTIVGGGTSTAAAYADLEADSSAGCSGATPNAFWCYRTSTGESLVVCKASGSTPNNTCQ